MLARILGLGMIGLIFIVGLALSTWRENGIGGDSLAAPLPATPLFVLSSSGSDNSIVVIDTATHAVVKTITYPDLDGAREFAVTPDGLLYIALDYTPYETYNEMLVIDAHTGTIVTQFKTDYAPMKVHWIGNDTVMVGHAFEAGGHNLVLFDTKSHTVTERLNRPNELIDVVTIGDVVYLAERRHGISASVVAYDRVTKTITKKAKVTRSISHLMIADQQTIYVSVYDGKKIPGDPCNSPNGLLRTLNPTTGKLDERPAIAIALSEGGLGLPSATTVFALDTCVDLDHASLTVFDSATTNAQAQILIPSHVSMTMSQVTPQGEIAVFQEDGQLHWYDATTLDAHGQTTLPVNRVSGMMQYPTEAKIRK